MYAESEIIFHLSQFFPEISIRVINGFIWMKTKDVINETDGNDHAVKK